MQKISKTLLVLGLALTVTLVLALCGYIIADWFYDLLFVELDLDFESDFALNCINRAALLCQYFMMAGAFGIPTLATGLILKLTSKKDA